MNFVTFYLGLPSWIPRAVFEEHRLTKDIPKIEGMTSFMVLF